VRMCNIQEFITAKLISISISQTQSNGPAVDSGKIERNCPEGHAHFCNWILCNFHNRFVQKKIAGQVSNYLYEFM